MPLSAAHGPVVDWLLDGDPSIRWQTLRDVVGASPRAVQRERSRIASDGWGARLLAKQGRSGKWAGGRSPDVGLYTPKWTSTTYTLLLLRDFGLAPANERARRGAALLLDRGLQPDGGVNFGSAAARWQQGETCITGMVLSLVSYFEIDDERVDVVADHLRAKQMPDGGWNCRRAATHSSVNTTISALEGLRLYELHRPARAAMSRAARATSGSRMPSRSCASGAALTADGHWRTRTRARPTSTLKPAARRADGTRCVRCAC